MARWTVVENDPAVTFRPWAPEGPHITVEGRIDIPDGVEGRYRQTEDQLGPGVLRVVVQCGITQSTNGIACWYPARDGDWYVQTSHFKNTLLNDPEFTLLMDQHVRAVKESK